MNKAPLKALRRHPAQMRTILDLEKLATLTLQVHARDLDEWQPIVAAADGDGYAIVSGHRRHTARLLAFALDDWRPKQTTATEPVTIENVRQMLKALVKEHGSLEAAAEALLATYGDREVGFALFEGDEKSQILALQTS